MTVDIWITVLILLVTIGLFVWDRLPLSVVAFLSVFGLLITELITPDEALAGLSNSAVFIVGGMFVVGAGIAQTGVASALGVRLGRIAGTNEIRMTLLVMGVITLISAFMSSTGATAILLPVVVSLAVGAQISPSKLMLPLAYGALIGGMMTLIGTPPNIVVSDFLADQGYEPFGFFAFTPMGIIIWVIAVAYMLTVGRWLTPERVPPGANAVPIDDTMLTLADLTQPYAVQDRAFALYVSSAALLSGHSPRSANIRERYHVDLLGMQVQGGELNRPARVEPITPETIIPANTVLYAWGERAAVEQLATEQALRMRPLHEDDLAIISNSTGLIEILLTPRSSLIGRSLAQIRFRERYGLNVLRILRLGKPLNSIVHTPLQFGDTLLAEGSWERVELLRNEKRDVVVVAKTNPGDPDVASDKLTLKGWTAVAILGVMVAMMITGIVPIITAVLFAALAMLLTNCLTIEDAYRAMSWESIFVIAGMIPLATALENTGAIQLLSESMVRNLGPCGPAAIMAGIFLVTVVLSQFASNTAITILMAPVAFKAAVSLGVNPATFLMTIAVATSVAFATPTGSPVNVLVMGPGGFRFTDFARVGVPLQIIILVVTVLVLPLLFPL